MHGVVIQGLMLIVREFRDLQMENVVEMMVKLVRMEMIADREYVVKGTVRPNMLQQQMLVRTIPADHNVRSMERTRGIAAMDRCMGPIIMDVQEVCRSEILSTVVPDHGLRMPRVVEEQEMEQILTVLRIVLLDLLESQVEELMLM